MKLVIIGEVLVDVVLGSQSEHHKMRLGGISHAALAAWAAGIEYEAYYICPPYLQTEVEKYFKIHGCLHSEQIGSILGSPGVILIGEPKEIGDQQYSLLMSDTITSQLEKYPSITGNSNVLIFPGDYDLCALISNLASNLDARSVKLSIDIANGIDCISKLNEVIACGKHIDIVFNSTSHHVADAEDNLLSWARDRLEDGSISRYILKENRGGGRLLSSESNITYPFFPESITHSVGVGDAFDTFFLGISGETEQIRLRRASLLASRYAVTNFPDDFRNNTRAVLKNITKYDRIEGIRVSFEEREFFKIYVAAPDFDWMDTSYIRELERSLKYHNFTPLLPIKINGQIDDFGDLAKVSEVFSKDIELIHESSIVIAVNLDNDPGTLIEIGYASGIGKPVIVYDPLKMARNPMLTELPILVTDDLERVIGEVFKLAAQK